MKHAAVQPTIHQIAVLREVNPNGTVTLQAQGVWRQSVGAGPICPAIRQQLSVGASIDGVFEPTASVKGRQHLQGQVGDALKQVPWNKPGDD